MITEIFGENCKRAKVIDLLLSHPHTEYTKIDISDCAEIARGTLDTFIDELEEIGIFKTTSKIGKFQLYQINMDSPITQALNSFQNQLADIEIEKQITEYEKTHNTEIDIKRPFEEMTKIDLTINAESWNGTISNVIRPIKKILETSRNQKIVIEYPENINKSVFSLTENSTTNYSNRLIKVGD